MSAWENVDRGKHGAKYGVDLEAKLDRLYELALCVNRLSWLSLIMTTVALVLVYSKYP
jgi:hypothetical protein